MPSARKHVTDGERGKTYDRCQARENMRPMPSAKRAGKQRIAVVAPGPFPMCQQISERMEILKDVPLFSIPTERTGKFLYHL